LKLTGFFLILFWKYQRNIFINLKAKIKEINKVYYFGIATGICLIIHTFFLGIKFDNDFYKENEKLYTNPGGNFILQPCQELIAIGSKEQLNILNGLLGNLVVAVELLK